MIQDSAIKREGSIHQMQTSGMLTIRRSATKEEKEAAAAFISLCLSYEGQSLMAKDLDFALSVRRDVLEEQIASMPTTASLYFFGEVNIKDNMILTRNNCT